MRYRGPRTKPRGAKNRGYAGRIDTIHLGVRITLGYDHFTYTLRRWQELYLRLPVRSVSHGISCSWESAHVLIRCAERLDNYALQQLQKAISMSDAALSPLRDPLTLNLGAHRWLSKDREESYSDWLAWVLQGMSVSEIFPLFGLDDEAAIRTFGEVEEIRREDRSEYGRTDIEVRFDSRGLLLIEVKVRDPGSGLPSQLERYVQRTREHSKHRRLVLLALEEPKQTIAPFVFINWQTLCKRLRLRASRLKESDLLRAASILIFCGAVEQNLLGLSVPPRRFDAMATVDYLHRWEGET